MAWDPSLYLKFGDERTRPVADLLARVQTDRPAVVVDLGCGPGNSTAALCARWPDARVAGFDSSSEMIAAARRSGLPARFEAADFESWSVDAPDVIFSNAALHWDAAPIALAGRLLARLAPGGTLAFQIPQNFDRPSHTVPYALAAKFGVADACLYDPVSFPRAADFAHALAAAHLDIWTTDYLHMLRGEHPVFDWLSGSALRPILARLDEVAAAEFAAEAKRRYAAAYPRESDGVTLFPFRRLFVVARRR